MVRCYGRAPAWADAHYRLGVPLDDHAGRTASVAQAAVAVRRCRSGDSVQAVFLDHLQQPGTADRRLLDAQDVVQRAAERHVLVGDDDEPYSSVTADVAKADAMLGAAHLRAPCLEKKTDQLATAQGRQVGQRPYAGMEILTAVWTAVIGTTGSVTSTVAPTEGTVSSNR